jgi:citrate lyase beta subunit
MSEIYRSLLFVPGSRPDRFEKAVASGADAIILDLEDAVLPADKMTARLDAIAWLAQSKGQAVAGLRINSPRTATGCADIAALAESGAEPAFIMVPKAETGIDMEIVREALAGQTVVAVIESGRGLSNAYAIARQSNGGVLFGGADFSASLGADLSNWDAMIHARGTVASACGAGGCPAYDVPFLDIKDEAGLRESTGKAKAFGFSGRTCIHPSQVTMVNAAFTPSEAEVSEARAIIAALEASGGGAVLHMGKLIDKPIILAAERILARART